ncbi:MAG: GNAT family N-acetyltransferase [Bacteroidota bacterium]
MDIQFKIAASQLEFEHGKTLFQLYVDQLGVDLSFQNFKDELESLATQYNKPDGALIIAYAGETAIGCVAIRKLDAQIGELKRMFVLPDYRKYKIGKKLLEESIRTATALGYKKIRLDTLPTMTAAQNLYRQYGFYEIPPYRFNPIEGTIFMEKLLSDTA